jgi:hypothetical protein
MDKIEQIARMCHQTNKAWCELNGDNSQRLDEAQQWQRDSAIKGVNLNLTTLMQGTTHNTMLGWLIK